MSEKDNYTSGSERKKHHIKRSRQLRKKKSQVASDRSPVAYIFEVKGEDYPEDCWQEKVQFADPRETYVSYGGFEVRNIRPLYTDNED